MRHLIENKGKAALPCKVLLWSRREGGVVGSGRCSGTHGKRLMFPWHRQDVRWSGVIPPFQVGHLASRPGLEVLALVLVSPPALVPSSRATVAFPTPRVGHELV